MNKVFAVLLFLLLLTLGLASAGQAVTYVKSPPLTEVVKTPVGGVKGGAELRIPIITWGADMAILRGNGDSLASSAGGIFPREGIKAALFKEDNFPKQVEAYLRGDTPFLRGTLGMVAMAAELLSRDPRTAPVIIHQLSWSAGGDSLVVKPGINSVADLKGKTVALQAYGPHIEYLLTLLGDAGLSPKDVNIRYTRDLTASKDKETPADAIQEGGVDAAFVITPDAMALTSGGKVGTGAEGSVKGAKILLSTKTASRVITDVYAVRSDYLASNRKTVETFVHALMLSEESLRLAAKGKKPDYAKTMKAAARVFFDSEQAVEDAEGLYGDCETIDFAGAVRFFTDKNWPRRFELVADEIQAGFTSLGLLSRRVPIEWAKWDYAGMKAGLSGTEGVSVPRFDTAAATQAVVARQASGPASGALFSFEILFAPNSNRFSAELYRDAFNEAIKKAATYSGAVLTIEGHSDPHAYLQGKKGGAPEEALRRQRQSALNLSVTRAQAVRDALISYAASQGVTMDQSQFVTIGKGISQPKTGMCGADPCPPKTELEWRGNMRVVFQVYNMEAESNVFSPLGN